jgi:hypothetical protein
MIELHALDLRGPVVPGEGRILNAAQGGNQGSGTEMQLPWFQLRTSNFKLELRTSAFRDQTSVRTST